MGRRKCKKKQQSRRRRQRGGVGIPKFVFTAPEKIRKSLIGERANNILKKGEKAINVAKVLQNHLRNMGPINLQNQRGGLPFLPLAMGLASVSPFISNALNKAIAKI